MFKLSRYAWSCFSIQMPGRSELLLVMGTWRLASPLAAARGAAIAWLLCSRGLPRRTNSIVKKDHLLSSGFSLLFYLAHCLCDKPRPWQTRFLFLIIYEMFSEFAEKYPFLYCVGKQLPKLRTLIRTMQRLFNITSIKAVKRYFIFIYPFILIIGVAHQESET